MSVEAGEIIREVRIAAAPSDVFPYFTDPEKLVAWKAETAELDARPGGGFRMDVTGRGDVARGRVPRYRSASPDQVHVAVGERRR